MDNETKFITKNSLFFVVLIIFCHFGINAQQVENGWNYEISCAGTGADGTYLVKMVSYGKTVEAAVAQAKKDAVHGVLFRGFSGQPGQCTSQRPIIPSTILGSEKEDYFEKFFVDGGNYLNFVSVNQSGITPTKMKKGYKVEVIASVAKDRLRKEMESAGIIKSLSSGF